MYTCNISEYITICRRVSLLPQKGVYKLAKNVCKYGLYRRYSNLIMTQNCSLKSSVLKF